MMTSKNRKKPEEKVKEDEIEVSSTSSGSPAKETAPDQTILDKPEPKRGMKLKDSWTDKLRNQPNEQKTKR